MVTAAEKVWDDLVASNKKYSWYRTNQLLYTDSLETCFDGRHATGEGARSIQSAKAIRSIENDERDRDEDEDKDEDGETQLQYATQELDSQALLSQDISEEDEALQDT
jgi:hypothetical protein